jgi:hypothetical protein
MKFFRRATTLIGVVALTASTLLASDAMAQQISTTITVENSTPACVDPLPTSLSLNFGTNTSGGSFGTLTGSGPTFTNKEISGSVFMSLYVNECLGQGWTVTAAVTDFHSGSNTVGSAGRIGMYAQTGSVFMGITTDYTKPVRPKPAPYNSFSNPTVVPGVSGLPTGTGNTNGGRTFVASGPDLSVASGPVSQGTVESTGDMVQAIKLRTTNVPNTTAPGTYSADFTLTFTSTGP